MNPYHKHQHRVINDKSDEDDLVDTDVEEQNNGREEEVKEENDEEETYIFKDNSSSPSKRLKQNEIEPFNMSTLSENFYIELLQGGIELISLETEPGKNGFLGSLRNAFNSRSQRLMKYNIITFATCRQSPDDPRPLYNPLGKGETQQYVYQVIVRAVEKSNRSSRRAVLQELCDICNEYNFAHPPKNYKNDLAAWQQQLTNSKTPKFVVPPNYDRTPSIKNLRKLDYHLVPGHVINIIHHMYNNVTATWANENPIAAEMYFSRPYPEEAIRILGYVNDE